MAYEERGKEHALHLDNRHHLSISGVEEVERFDETLIALHTAAGYLLIRGEDLHIEKLNLEGGELSVTGLIESLCYEDKQPKAGGFFGRLFGI